MKHLSVLLLLLVLVASLHAQRQESLAKSLEDSPSIEVSPEILKINKETQNGFMFYLNASQDEAEKKWKEFLTTNHRAEVKKIKGGFVCENTSITDITSASLTVTALFYEEEDGCEMNVFFNMNGYYLNPKEHAKESMAVVSCLMDYQKELYVDVYKNTLEAQGKAKEKSQKVLDKLVKEGEKLDKDVSKGEGDVNKAEQTIIDSEQKIVELQAKIEQLGGEIEQSKSTIVELKKAKEKKASEIEAQKTVVNEKKSQIDRIKNAADKAGVN